MRIMYWNATTPADGTSPPSQNKLNTIHAAVGLAMPDVLCLDETSVNIKDKVSADAFAQTNLKFTVGGVNYGYYALGVIANMGTHLNQAVFAKGKVSGARTIEINSAIFKSGIPDADWDTDLTKRDLSFVDYGGGTTRIRIWFLHANASDTGGTTAVRLVRDFLLNNKSGPTLFIGDFNAGLDSSAPANWPHSSNSNSNAQTTTIEQSLLASNVTPVRPALPSFPDSRSNNAVVAANFTQWTRGVPGLRIPGAPSADTCNPSAKGVIDFAIAHPGSAKMKVEAAAILPSIAAGPVAPNPLPPLSSILLYCDHLPIAYDVTLG